MTEIRRRRTPIVFVAYGDGGVGWLRSLRVRCSENATVRTLMEHEIVQFWCVGAQAVDVDGITTWSDTPGVQDVSGMLDSARSAMSMAIFTDLNVREVL